MLALCYHRPWVATYLTYGSKGDLVAKQFESIDDYIESFPAEVQAILEAVRRSIRKSAPEAEETISYQMPTFTLNGKYLVYFGGWKHHIGLYPVPAVDEELEKELSKYRATKGTLRFPLQEPIPYGLIEKLVAVRLASMTQATS
jgi:uncharacterized protein YdhG (YjbR/CyaY superfamily)